MLRLLRSAHPASRGFDHDPSKSQRPVLGDGPLAFLVEAAGIEPASASTPLLALHA